MDGPHDAPEEGRRDHGGHVAVGDPWGVAGDTVNYSIDRADDGYSDRDYGRGAGDGSVCADEVGHVVGDTLPGHIEVA